MNREIYFEPNLKCDICGKLGAYDFMGDSICQECLEKEREETKL